MATVRRQHFTALEYERYAQEYCASLPLEHFMEAPRQGTQRKIMWDSLDVVHISQPEVQVFNELLVQYPMPRRRQPGQVVPDNMVVIYKEPLELGGSFDVELQPARPFWVLEYVSDRSQRKDYQDSFRKYEQELKVPYCLLVHPEKQDLRLYRHDEQKYVAVKPNKQKRYAIPRLKLEVALLDGWARLWHRGELVPLPSDLVRELDEARRKGAELERRAEEERQARLALEREVETLRARLQQRQAGANGP